MRTTGVRLLAEHRGAETKTARCAPRSMCFRGFSATCASLPPGFPRY